MTDDNSVQSGDAKDGKKKLKLSRPGKLQLNKTIEAGQVKQSFSHGRSKAVAVEVRRKKTYAPGKGGRMTEIHELAEAALQEGHEAEHDDEVLDSLTSSEKLARSKALQEAIRAHDASRHKAEEEAREAAAKRRAVQEARQEEQEERRRREAREAEEKAKAEAEAEEKTKAKADVKQAGSLDQAPASTSSDEALSSTPSSAAKDKPRATEERADRPKKGAPKEADRVAAPNRKSGNRRRGGKLTISQALGGETERTRSLAAVKRAREKQKQKSSSAQGGGQKRVREVIIPDIITVQELANRMAERGAVVIKTLMQMGVMATITQTIDADTAELVTNELGHTAKRVSEADVELGLSGGEDSAGNLQSRPPVVTIMGHVDHGKTSLLDALRATDVAGGEAGGITQHIGAYQVTLASGGRISFIDTPGHEAFTAMRARGAKVTDIVVLVVAADDGVMPQTIEAIRHAKAAGAPLIVAINKIDKPGADANRVRTELLNYEIQVEEMGGEVLSIEVSAKQRLHLDKLEEAILLQAELLDLKANPDRQAEGVVVEAKMEKGRGPVITVLIQRGTIKVGDVFVAGGEWGRVRALNDDRGRQVDNAGPGTPVEVLGLNGVPAAGDEFIAVESEARAREVSEFRQRRERQSRVAAQGRSTLEQMFSRIKDGDAQALPVVVKADVQGSVEAILGAVEKMATDEVRVNVLHSGVGGINESDVTLAAASQALIIGFNVRANPQARDLARRDGTDIRYYSIIYDVADDIRQMLSGMLAPSVRENLIGYAEIREVFNISKVGRVAGCMITEGVVKRGAGVRLLRDDVVVHQGNLSTLQRFKDQVSDVREGYECGMSFTNYNDIQVGDVIECFEVEKIARQL